MKRQENKDKILIITGLNSFEPVVKTFGWMMRMRGIDYEIFDSHWKDWDYHRIVSEFVRRVDKSSENRRLSLVGVSAGGALAVPALAFMSDKIHRVVTFSGWNTNPEDKDLLEKHLEILGISSIAFWRSAKNLDHVHLNEELVKRMLNFYGEKDRLVPKEASIIKGADNVDLGNKDHEMAIGEGMILRARRVAEWVVR